MSHLYEIEVKSLLGSKDSADELLSKLKRKYPVLKLSTKGKQLNHYFIMKGDVDLVKELQMLIPKSKIDELNMVLKEGKKISIRTKKTINEDNEKVAIVIKASVGDDTSDNGIKRIEFESNVDLTHNELDKILLKAGLEYQAKWSREREEYTSDQLHICIDKNAGYGYLAEFEMMTSDERKLDDLRVEILSIMSDLGVEELSQDRIERMFTHYNANWDKYYGTDNTFTLL